ncbi:MAG TPA: NTP transferase domain-containing protein [Acidimicrobiales bacterium]|nr:NTP transferase domain-containing protein [Acidimicrobiales bacterium]
MPAGRAFPAFVGAVLCGGASRRMGRDKALVSVDGEALAARVAAALRAAGAADVVAVGGDAGALAALGLPVVPDAEPGAGPLTGLVTALGRPGLRGRVAFVAACDLVAPSPAAIRATVAALAAAPEGDVAVPVAGGRRQWMHAAWRAAAGAPLAAAFAAGERAVHAAVAAAALRVVEVAVDPAAVADADVPGDLPAGRAAGPGL